MNRSYNTALILLRFFGVACIAMGLMGLVFVGITYILGISGAPRWIIEHVWPYAAQSLVGSPLYLLLGAIVLGLSRRLARLVSKFCENERP